MKQGNNWSNNFDMEKPWPWQDQMDFNFVTANCKKYTTSDLFGMIEIK